MNKTRFFIKWRYLISALLSILCSFFVLHLCNIILFKKSNFLFEGRIVNKEGIATIVEITKDFLPVLTSGLLGLLGLLVAGYSLAIITLSNLYTKQNQQYFSNLEQIKQEFHTYTFYYVYSIITAIILFTATYLLVHTEIPFSYFWFAPLLFVIAAIFFYILFNTAILIFDIVTLVNMDVILKLRSVQNNETNHTGQKRNSNHKKRK